MANPVITFEVKPASAQIIVMAELQRAGYMNTWSSNSQRYQLPFNSVWKLSTEFEVALTDLTNCISRLNATRNATENITLVSYLILNATPWKASPIVATLAQ